MLITYLEYACVGDCYTGAVAAVRGRVEEPSGERGAEEQDDDVEHNVDRFDIVDRMGDTSAEDLRSALPQNATQ